MTDICRRHVRNLDFQKKSIGFEEERKELKVKKKNALSLRKTRKKNQITKADVIDLRLNPEKIQSQKIVDLYKPRHKSFEEVYRLFQITPGKQVIKKEIWRFGVIAMTTIFLLNLVGVYSNGILLKEDLEAKAFGAYENLLEAANSAGETDFIRMFSDFQNANNLMKEAELILADELNIEKNLGFDSPLQNVSLILKTGTHISKAGQYLAKTIYNVQNLPDLFMAQNNESVMEDKPRLKITDKIKADSGYLNLALTEIQNAESYLNEIKAEYLPNNFQDKFLSLKSKVVEIKKVIMLIQGYIPITLDLLGDRYPQRYLILLQNNHEARATGGFIGSYLMIDINDGEITKFELKDVYESDGQMYEEVAPPEGLHKITENWRMRDANYSPDFPTSAQQVMWFLEHEKGPTVDTVIAINQRVIENILKYMPPIQMPGLEIEITAENFTWMFSYLIEAKFSETSSPKQFLMDFAPILKDQLLQPQKLPFLLAALQESIQQKDILAFSTNPEVNELVKQLDVDGEIYQGDESFDYLQVINTSIGGNKSDGFIRQKMKHQTKINRGGEIIDTLTVVRKHTWYHEEDAIFEELYKKFGAGKLERQELKDIIGFGGNKNLMRVYVPLGTQLISATGSVTTEEVMIYNDLGKTVFAFEQPVVYTERESYIKLNYLLPHKLDSNYADNYKLILQNQPGQEENYFDKTIELEGDLNILQQFPQTVFKETNQKASFSKFLKGDEYLSVVISNNK